MVSSSCGVVSYPLEWYGGAGICPQAKDAISSSNVETHFTCGVLLFRFGWSACGGKRRNGATVLWRTAGGQMSEVRGCDTEVHGYGLRVTVPEAELPDSRINR